MVPSIAKGVRRILGRPRPPSEAAPARDRLVLPADPELIYAVGDVHGCLPKLLRLEQKIVEDAAAFDGIKVIVMLGDYVDRGPDSAGVIEHLLRPAPDGFFRVCLCGNHEDVFVHFLQGMVPFESWIEFGAEETLLSYGLDRTALDGRGRKSRSVSAQDVLSVMPSEHVSFLRKLPVALSTPSCYFVHAGVRPGVELEAQAERDLLWIRKDFLESEERLPKLVIHGHTPSRQPTFANRRLGIDTGAYMNGPLTAARLWRRKISFLEA